MKLSLKQIITLLVLMSFLTVVLFSFTSMAYGPDGRMEGECPFSNMGQSICPQDTVAVAIHHISAYSGFLNVPVGSMLTALIISLFAVFCAAMIIFIRLPLLEPPALVYAQSDSPPDFSYKRKVTRWLSLFENSPSHF